MKSKLVIGVLIVIAVIALIVIFIISRNNQTAVKSTQTAPVITQTVSPTAAVQSPTAAPTLIPSALRAKVRSDFIKNCTTTVGSQYLSACNCAADYLAAHYSDVQLAEMYVAYHSSNKVTPEIQKVIDACKTK